MAPPGHPVEHQLPYGDHVTCAGGSAHQGAQAGLHLLEFIGFAQIVVGPCVQACNALFRAVARAEDENRCPVPPGTGRPQRGEATAQAAAPARGVGQVQVQQHRIKRLHSPPVLRLFHRLRPLHAVPRLFEPLAHGSRQNQIVFNQQDTHRFTWNYE